jgi:hypothetical protein
MHEYEIRVLRADRCTGAVMEVTHFDDDAAVGAARKIAGTMPFEVWRGMDCIYGEHPIGPPRPSPPSRPSA